ncbi:MAG: 30S ribosomal protein THX [Gammaproteobacteria bacterium]|nr:30S ribosomal protein THX [Gammaproteobacteria bacterium]MCY4342682.1 30S ribosomal protein THX [Gammaproteobacteria bacterium]MCY4342685.1 30S ribosomal protein THX [Gammaproteobacteria bacterium]
MGKGDQRTRRGKIVRGTFGVRRPKKRKPDAQQEERRRR